MAQAVAQAKTRVADPLLTVEGLRVQFVIERGPVRAVDGVDFDVNLGEAVGIVGESGSGKSMTALSILRLVPASGRIADGAIRFAGVDLLKLSNREMQAVRFSEIALIFQDPGSFLNPIMTISDQILEAIGRRGSKEPADTERVVAVLKAVQIPEPARVMNAYPHELSGGMQQRAMIASVLIRRPKLIIADEPTTALDATVQYQILKLLGVLRAELNAALILISHDLAVIAEVCDQVNIMYAGQLIESGGTAEIFDNPKHPYTKALIASILDPWEVKLELAALEGSPPDMTAPPPGCRFHPRCPSAFEPCSSKAPPDFSFGGGHRAACWLYGPTPEDAS